MNRPQLREPGVTRQLPQVSSDGQGVNRPQLREPGVHRKRPHVSDDGRGVNHPGTREPGVTRQLPHVSSNGQGVNHAGTREPGVGDDYHPMAMPELLRWFEFLSARLRHVRILNGDWTRACTSGVLKTLSLRTSNACGVFLDPPYSDVRSDNLYASDSLSVAHDVRDWCVKNGADPQLRIVLAGFDTEHTDLASHGWRAVEWYRSGFLKGGMAQQGEGGTNQKRERLWLSPHCMAAPQGDLFAA